MNIKNYPRYCNITGDGMFEGFVFNEDIYIKYQSDLIKKIKEFYLNNGSFHLDFPDYKEWNEGEWLDYSYDDELHYWTEWYEGD